MAKVMIDVQELWPLYSFHEFDGFSCDEVEADVDQSTLNRWGRTTKEFFAVQKEMKSVWLANGGRELE